jgi:uncharacterized membrane protein
VAEVTPADVHHGVTDSPCCHSIAFVNKSRVETFSDGVFAIAITLLVLTIAEPSNYNRLANQLGQRWPDLAAYVVTFLVIGIMWLNHHTIFRYLGSVDRRLIYLNLFLLMTIAFLPYPTGIFGRALAHGRGATTAAVFYSVTMFLNACCWAGLWLHASRGRRLLVPQFPEGNRRKMAIMFTGGTGAYAIAIGIAFVNAFACLAFHGALAIYYALDPLSRGAEREMGGDGDLAGEVET